MAEQEQDELEPIAVETQVTDTATGSKSLGVTIPAEDVTKAFNAILGELASTMRMPGFRPGKVPRNLIEKRFAEDIQRQAAANLVQRATHSAFLKEKLDVIGEPKLVGEKLKPQKGQPFSFSVEVEVRPAFELINYKGLVVEQEEVELLPEEIDEALDRLRQQGAEILDAPPGHAMGEGDVAKGTLRFSIAGKEIHTEEAELFVLEGHVLGAYAHLEDKFLAGAKAGEKRSTAATLGERFPVAEQRGQTATIDFEIQSIRQHKLPPADDALAQKMGLKTLDDLKNQVRSSLLENLSEQVRQRTQYELLDRIVSATPFELPKRLQDTMSQVTSERSLDYLKQLGMDTEALAAQHRAKLEADAKERAGTEMRRYFIIEAICNKEGITVTDEDVDAEIVSLARSKNMRASDLYDKLRDSGELHQLEASLKTRKALEFLVEQAAIKIVPRKPRPKKQGHEQCADAGPAAQEAASPATENAPAEKPPATDDEHSGTGLPSVSATPDDKPSSTGVAPVSATPDDKPSSTGVPPVSAAPDDEPSSTGVPPVSATPDDKPAVTADKPQETSGQ